MRNVAFILKLAFIFLLFILPATLFAQTPSGALGTQQVIFFSNDFGIAPRTLQEQSACIVDGVLYDECPLGDPGDILGGGSGGGGTPTDPFPDLNPISGSISIPNPAAVGQPFNFQVVIANTGNPEIPASSLTTLPGIPIEGIVVNFHILRPGSGTPNASNLVFQGIFDPGHQTDDVSYFLSASFTLNGAFVTPGAQHQFAVVVDPGNLVFESSESNNVATSSTFSIASNPDLIPLTDGSNAQITPNPVLVGETVTIGCKVKNVGSVLNGPVTIRVNFTATLDGQDEFLNAIDLGTATRTINSGSSLAANGTTTMINLQRLINLPPGRYRINVRVDPQGQIPEAGLSGEANNLELLGFMIVGLSAGSVPALPDLTLMLTPGAQVGFPLVVSPNVDTLRTRITLVNASIVPVTTTFRVKVSVRRLNDPGTPYLHRTIRVSSIPARGSLHLRLDNDIILYLLFNKIGPQDLIFEVDPTGVITESNESNNTLTASSAITLAAPDITWDPSREITRTQITLPIIGTRTIVTIPIINRGNFISGSHRSSFYIRQSGIFTPMSPVITTTYPNTATPLLPPGAIGTYTASFPGTYAPASAHSLLFIEWLFDIDNTLNEIPVPWNGIDGTSTGLDGEDNNENFETLPSP